MKISIDKDKCIKCGLCANICPEVLTLGEDGIVVTYKEDESSAVKDNSKLIDDLKMAEKNCPMGGIKIEEDPTT